MIRVQAALLAAFLTLLAATPAVADDGYVDLRLTVSLDEDAYLATDEATMRVAVVNAGTAAATGVLLENTGPVFFAGDWGEFGQQYPGGTLAPGERAEFTATAHAYEAGEAVAQRVEVRSTEPDRAPADNVAEVRAPVTPVSGDLVVTVYGDADRDGLVGAREPMTGVVVEVAGFGGRDHQARTDGAGLARFTGLPAGRYSVDAQLRLGWVHSGTEWVDLRAGENTAELRAFPDTAKNLAATVAFDRARYAPGEPVRMRVTLTNPTAADVVGVYANCGRYGADNDIYSVGWGELDPSEDGPGAVIRAGETRTWEFTAPVPPLARPYGFVVLRCEFAHAGALTGAFAEARAAVPGSRGVLVGTAVHGITPLPGLTFLLLDQDTGKEVARARSDAAGSFRFAEIPAGMYLLRVLGPWKFKDRHLGVLQIMGGVVQGFNPLELLPGPGQRGPEGERRNQPSTVPVVPAPDPVAQASPRPADLADTGASVVELFALGFLLLVAGAALLHVRPRRT